MKNRFFLIAVSFWLVQCNPVQKKDGDLKDQIQHIFPEVQISEIDFDVPYTEAYEIILPQYLDHENPGAGTFDQHIYLYHTGHDKPMYMETEGYDVQLTPREISQKLGLNLIHVEYRFYGLSAPDSILWQYLTNDQAIEDYHRINQGFREIYKKGKWLTSGVSKGGETAMIYKSKYPKDADVVVPYVAPIILDTMDLRPWQHIATVGTAACRDNIKRVQKTLLKRKAEVLAKLQGRSDQGSFSYSLGMEVALEYAILEYPYAFWQWNANCDRIPSDEVGLDSLFNYLESMAKVSNYSDQVPTSWRTSYYQHMRELGYYAMDTAGLSPWLSQGFYSHGVFAPQNVDLSYDRSYMRKVKDYVENEGEQMIWVYGGLDPWGACAVEPKGESTMKFVAPNGTHSTRIKDLDALQQKQIYDSLRVWLGI